MAGASPETVFVGDDFTGASDTLATFSRANRSTRLFLDPPDPATVAAERLDVVGVATELRALGPDAIADQVGRIATALAPLRPRFLHYKVCSTFDSSPAIGSIGAAVQTLEAHLDPALVAIVGGQPSLGRYCLSGHLFAATSDGAVHRIDRHPVMRVHPTTPMEESDLRLHLAAQGLDRIGLVSCLEIAGDAGGLAGRIHERLARGERRILFDATESGHLETIGNALRLQPGDRPIVIVGASSVAESLVEPASQRVLANESRDAGGEGPCLVIAGSRSSVTASQIASSTSYDKFAVAPDDLANPTSAGAVAVTKILHAGRDALVHLAPEQNYGAGGVELARRLATFAATILDQAPVRALGIAGGDTSSVIVRRLGFESLAYHADLEPGVAICTGHSRNPHHHGMHLMLKGGQMGSAGLLDKFALAIR